MTATANVGYDLIFVVHLLAALATVVVLVSLRVAAAGVTPTADRATLQARFPDRVDWAARIVHLAPLTGITMSLLGDGSVSFARAWVSMGLALYLVLAYLLEARVLPAERALARVLREEGVSPRDAATRVGQRLDAALLVLAVILVTMVVQY